MELIVVDNASTDHMCKIAASLGAQVFTQGHERCAQRNRGWREAHGDVVFFVDADMILPATTIAEMLAFYTQPANAATALYIPEHRIGPGIRLRARNFERSFYDGTCIDGLRAIPRAALVRVGGYDESIVACEDWDLDRRLLAAGVPVAMFRNAIRHNEANQGLVRLLKKKAYYSTSVDAYRQKWNDDATCRKQFGIVYRYFGVFTENGKWK